MFDAGLGRKTIFQTDYLVLGLQSGFGYASNSYSDENIKMEVSSKSVPIKLFLTQRLLGLNIGTLLSFWKVEDARYSLKNVVDEGMSVYFDIGMMIFPMGKSFSINFDAITKSSATGYAIGVAYHFDKKLNKGNQNQEEQNKNQKGQDKKKQNQKKQDKNKNQNQEEQDNNGYDGEKSCSNVANVIQEAFINKEDENLQVCIRLEDKKLSCLKLSDISEFENESLEAIEDFDKQSSYLKWNKIPVSIPYTAFFPNGLCFLGEQHNE
jgi:hypothetical protein